MRRIIVLGNAQRAGVLAEAEVLLPFLRQHVEVVLVDLVQQQDLGRVEADLAVVLGGDGAILRAVRQMGYGQLPVLGINLGRLGFLADLTREEFCQMFPRLIQGAFRVTEHLMFEVSVVSAEGEPVAKTVLGLNEVAIQTGPPFQMLELDLLVDEEPVARYNGDGLILSTPVGSTAHSLSAGGPILAQELAAFVITPICPHGLTSRPLVDSADKQFTVVAIRATNAVAVIDGQEQLAMRPGTKLTVKKAEVSFKLARFADRSYYRTLRDKLHWGMQPNYRSEPQRPSERKEEIIPRTDS